MYCPDCGKQNPAGQKFCRSCGLSLKPISQALAGEVVPADALADSRTSSTIIDQREQRFWQNPLIYAVLLILFGLIIGAIGDKVVRTNSVADIGSVLALLGVGLLGFKGVMLVLSPPRYSTRAKRTTDFDETDERTYEQDRALLAAEPPSVTETTTRQLDAAVDRAAVKPRDTQPTL